MRVLVIGGTGNAGLGLLRRLESDPAVTSVVAASRRRPDDLPEKATWQPLDVRREIPPALLQDVDAVVHLAWLMQPTRAPRTTWEVNVEGTARLLRAVAASPVSTLVLASSVGAYSPRMDLAPVTEEHPTHGVPTAAYSREKAYVERLVDIFERDHPQVRTVRLRPAFIFQADAAVQQRRLFAGPLVPGRTLATLGAPVLPDPGGIRLQAVHTDDVAAAYHLALTREGASGAYNITAPEVLEVTDLAQLVGAARTVSVPRGVATTALRAAWAAHLTPASPGLFDLLSSVPMMSERRARTDLGWAPRWGAREAIADMLAGLRRHTGASTPPLDPRTSGTLRGHELRTSLEDTP